MAGYIGSKSSVTQVDGYNRTEADDRYVNASGDTMTGALALPAGGLTVGTDQLSVDASGRVTMPYQPAFMAYPTAHTYGPDIVSTWTTSGAYGSFVVGGGLSSDRYTAPVAGKYLFSISSLYNHGGDNAWARVWTMVNGASVVDGLGVNGTLNYQMVSYAVVLDLQANDYVQLRADDNGSNGFMYANNYTRWSGYLIG